MRAAALDATGGPLRCADVTLGPPPPGFVQVELAAAGVCRSDLAVIVS